jgi:PAS domain-containing protein
MTEEHSENLQRLRELSSESSDHNFNRLHELSAKLIEPDVAILIIENLPAAIVMFDSKRIIRFINKTAEKIFEYSRDNLVGLSIDIIFPNIKAFGSKASVIAQRRDGSLLWVEIDFISIDLSVEIMTVTMVVERANGPIR